MSTTIIKPNTEYVSYEPTMADEAVTLDSITGKQWHIANNGSSGYDVVVTYGSDTSTLTDGDDAWYFYDGTYWVKSMNNLFENGIQLTSGRKFAEEKVITDNTLTGWVTIAKLDSGYSYQGASCEITAVIRQQVIKFQASLVDRGASSVDSAKIKLLEYLNTNTTDGYIQGARIVYSSTTAGAGAWLDINIGDVGSGNLSYLVDANMMEQDEVGFTLIDPVASSSTLPDGTTTADTYLEAGTEIDLFTSDTGASNEIGIFVQDDDTIRIRILCGNILKQDATAISMEYPANGLRIYDPFASTVTSVAITDSDPFTSFKNISVDGKYLQFRAVKSGVFSGLTQGPPLLTRLDGAGGKLTLS